MKITPIFRARVIESSVRTNTSNRLLLPPKKISIALAGRSGAQHIICHLTSAHYRNYYKKDAWVYLQYRRYRHDAKYGHTSSFFDLTNTEYGMTFTNPIGSITHPMISNEMLEQEFERLYLVHLYNPSNAIFDFGFPTSKGVICDSDENATLVVLAQ